MEPRSLLVVLVLESCSMRIRVPASTTFRRWIIFACELESSRNVSFDTGKCRKPKSLRIVFIPVQAKEKCDKVMPLPTQPRAASVEDLVKIKSFLRENGLPDFGVDRCVRNFAIAEDENGSWVGVAGLELYGESGLLRSVAVDKRFRGRGCGRILVETVLGNAKDMGVKTVYLLTEGAAAYFEGLGFQTVDREDIDDAVRKSSEFTEVCCASAVAMRKAIGRAP
jgi:amino-acid N-acetyltransferase